MSSSSRSANQRQTQSTKIRPYENSDNEAVVRCLLKAFQADPWALHLLEGHDFEQVLGLIFRWMSYTLAVSFRMSEVLMDEETGEILGFSGWEPAEPTIGTILRSIALFCLMAWHHGFSICWKYVKLMTWLEKERGQLAPKNHHHLQVIGVNPDFSGQGLGSKLIQKGINRAANCKSGYACYLEASNPRNRNFYEKQGFCLIKECHPFENPETGEMGPVGLIMVLDPKNSNSDKKSI